MADNLPWRDAPPTPKKLPHLPLIRLGAGASLKCAITVPTAIGIDTHFFHRRTLPCTGENCPGCADGRPKRWEGYVAVWTAAPSRHVIIALTPGVAADLQAIAGDNANLRGRLVLFARLGKRTNGRVTITAEDNIVPTEKLPPEPDLRAHMVHIWGLDQSHVGQDAPDYAAEARRLYAAEPPAQPPA